jgi:hypothetical protein
MFVVRGCGEWKTKMEIHSGTFFGGKREKKFICDGKVCIENHTVFTHKLRHLKVVPCLFSYYTQIVSSRLMKLFILCALIKQ